MILIITHKADYTADFVINKLNSQNIPYKRFNCEDILDFDWTVEYGQEMRYSVLGEHQFSSVWFRRTKLPELSPEMPLADRLYITNEIDIFIGNLLAVIGGYWVSEPSHVYRAENKLLQLEVAQRLGFTIPATIITNSKEKLWAFYAQQKKDIIVKPLSQTRIMDRDSQSFIFTNSVTAAHMDGLEAYDLTPCIFQRRIEKETELRVTVVGDKIFAASVDSQSDPETVLDWRKKKLTFTAATLPKSIEMLCIKLVKDLHLQFGAIDLIKTPTGEYVFLEINPNGQWAWIEIQTGLNISQAIVDLLTKQ